MTLKIPYEVNDELNYSVSNELIEILIEKTLYFQKIDEQQVKYTNN